MFEQGGLQQREAPAAYCLFGSVEGEVGVLDLQDVDLEAGEDAAFDRFGQAQLVDPLAVGAGRIVPHGGDLQLAPVLTDRRPWGGQNPRGCGHVEPIGDRDAGVVVDRGPRPPQIPCRAVRLVHDRQVEAVHPLPIQALSARQSGLQRPTHTTQARRVLDVIAVHQRRVRGQHDHRPRPGPQRQLNRVRGRADPELLQELVAFQRAHADHGPVMPDPAPGLRGLHEQIESGDHDQDPVRPEQVQRRPRGGDRFP